MTGPTQATIGCAQDRRREGWQTPDWGDATWFTLFSGDITPTERMSAGIMELMPGGAGLKAHRHAQPEIYYVAEGTGALTVEGVETVVSAGQAAFIPGDAEHAIRNVAETMLRIFYVFPADCFSEVIYRFADVARQPDGVQPPGVPSAC